MPIFELSQAVTVKSHVWKFGFDWLSLSRVIIWIFRRSRNPLLGGYMWPAMPIFELGRAIPVRNRVWKFGSDWLSLSRVIVSTNIFPGGGQKPPIREITFDLWCPFSNSDELFQSCVKIWFGLVEIGGMLMLRWVTCDLRCPFLNLAEHFQSKVMCENLVQIDWAFQELLC